MGYRVLRVHTAGDDLEFKTLEPKDLFDNVVAHLERLRNEPSRDSVPSTASADFVTAQIKKLGELRYVKILTNGAQINKKKAELLARL